jgi:TIR domain
MLSTRLVNNGVDALLDQWNLSLGSDLAHFMETGLAGADRVLAICSANYVQKANMGQGGVGYEKMILTGQLMKNLTADRIIPIVRSNSSATVVPTFLGSRVYIDFRDDLIFETRYTELLRDIHRQPAAARPTLGQNPFVQVTPEIDPKVSFTSERYISPSLSGTVTFEYSNNNGSYVVGAGDMQFETSWSAASDTSIHAYSDAPSIRAIALAIKVTQISDIVDATVYDTSSRTRSPEIGEIVIWQNTAGYYLATKVEKVACRGRAGAQADELVFSYVIAADKGADFSR